MPRFSEGLQRRAGIYHFRMRVPDVLRQIIGKREIRKSLQTCDPKRARRSAALERMKALALFEEAERQRVASPSPSLEKEDQFTDEDLWSLATTWFVATQKADEQRSVRDVDATLLQMDLGAASSVNSEQTLTDVRLLTTKFLRQQNVALNWSSPHFRRLEALMHEAYIERQRRLVRRFVENSGVDLNPRFSQLGAESVLHPGSKLTLAQLIAKFQAEKLTLGVAPKDKAEMVGSVALV